MGYLVNSHQMKSIDAYTIHDLGVPSLVLMERAALAVAERIILRAGFNDKIGIICGSGNNGGDGAAIARILLTKGFEPELIFVGNEAKATEETIQQLTIARRLGVRETTELDKSISYDILVDAIFGIGLSKPVEGRYAALIQSINESGAYIIAVDAPSGISCDNGQVMGCAVKAAETVTFGLMKTGLVLYPGASYAGQVIVADIGFPRIAAEQAGVQLYQLDRHDLFRLPKRVPYSNKGTYGKVLTIAGSRNMAGACYLSATAAYLTGCGLVKVITEDANRSIIQQLVPEAILETWEPDRLDMNIIKSALDWADTVVIGPGLGTSRDAADLTRCVLENSRIPVIMDADAINLFAIHPEWQELRKCPLILTPHVGEMARLTGKTISEVTEQLIPICQKTAKQLKAVCVLKDSRTIISAPNGKTSISLAGNNGMSTGGSGDVLTGIIAGLIAQQMDTKEAAVTGVLIHGLAGDKAAQNKGTYSLMARDLLAAIHEVLMDLTDKENS